MYIVPLSFYCIYCFLSRPSQIACTVTTVYIMFMQMALHVHKNLCTVLIPQCRNNLNLSISCLDQIKTITATAFLISNKEVLNPCSHRTTFDSQSFISYCKFQVSLINLSQSDIQILCGLQIGNGIHPCVNSN